jgi:hypothetical protein
MVLKNGLVRFMTETQITPFEALDWVWSPAPTFCGGFSEEQPPNIGRVNKQIAPRSRERVHRKKLRRFMGGVPKGGKPEVRTKLAYIRKLRPATQKCDNPGVNKQSMG